MPGFGETVLAPIPLTEIKTYLELFGGAGADDAEAFIQLIRAADQAYLAGVAERRNKGDGAATPSSKRETARGP